jgi:hypothetical protein
MRIQIDDGTVFDAAAGDVHIPSGRDALVVGDDSCLALGLG